MKTSAERNPLEQKRPENETQGKLLRLRRTKSGLKVWEQTERESSTPVQQLTMMKFKAGGDGLLIQ